MKQNPTSRSQQAYLRDDVLPSLLSGSYAFVSSLTYFFIPLFLQDHLKFSGSQIGILYAGLSVTGLFITFPIGFLNDLFTPRTLILISLITTALALWGQGAVTGFITFFLVFLLFGVSNNIFRTSLDALMFKGAQEENRGTRYGLFNAMRMIGFTAGALFAGYALLSFDFTAKLRHLSVFALALVLAYPFLAATPGKRWELFNYRRDFYKKEVIVFSLWLFFFTLHWGAESTCVSLFLRHHLGLHMPGIGYYMATEFIAVALASFWCGKLVDRGIGPERLLYPGLIASGLGHILMTYPNVAFSLSWRVIHGIGDGAVMIAMYEGIGRLFHVDRVGGNASLIYLVTLAGSFAGALIFGPMGEYAGYWVPLAISGLITLVLLPVLLWWQRWEDSHAAL
jgi:MFS family permease